MLSFIKSKFSAKTALITLISVVIILTVSVGSTIAYVTEKSNAVVNKFSSVSFGVTVKEEFDGKVKKNVSAENTGEAPCYVRIQLSSYRVDNSGNHIGGVATVPSFTKGDGWLDMGGNLYVYNRPVAVGSTPAKPLIGASGITLVKYTDEDGGKQVVEVMAESVSSADHNAVKTAWGVNVSSDGTITL